MHTELLLRQISTSILKCIKYFKSVAIKKKITKKLLKIEDVV